MYIHTNMYIYIYTHKAGVCGVEDATGEYNNNNNNSSNNNNDNDNNDNSYYYNTSYTYDTT